MTETAASVLPEAPRITRALRVEIAKPLNCTWDDAGRQLRDIRSVIHRLYEASAQAARWTEYRNHHGEVAGHPQTRAYQAVEEELADIRAWAAAAARKKKAVTAEGGETADTRTLERLAGLELPGGMKAGISGAAFTGFQKWRKDKGRVRFPSWKYGAPIPVRAQESALRLEPNGGVVMSVKLTAGRSGAIDFAIIAGKGSHWERLRALAKGENADLKRGDIKILYSMNDKKWFAFIAYSEPAPATPTGLNPEHVMVVHRGQRNLVVCATNQGHYSVLATGDKLRAFKRRMQARRESYQSVRRPERGSGAHGHGRARRYDVSEAISAAERNFVHTLCQQLGARVAKLALQWGCGTVAIEVYSGIEPSEKRGERMYLERFPNAELKGCIEWALKKQGMPLGEYAHAYMSQTCPRCDSVDEAQNNKRTGVFHCKVCAFDRPVDVVGAIHALRRSCTDKTAGTWEGRLKMEAQLAAALRDGRSE